MAFLSIRDASGCSSSLPVRFVHSGIWNQDDMYINYAVFETTLEPRMTFMVLLKQIMTCIGIHDSIDMPTIYASMGSHKYLHRGIKLETDKDVDWLYRVLSTTTVNGCTLIVDAMNCISTFMLDNTPYTSTDMVDVNNGRFHGTLDVGRIPLGFNLRVNDIFTSKHRVQIALKAIALRDNFQFYTQKSCKKYLAVACIDRNCEWTIRASRKGGDTSETWVITKVVDDHSCSLDIVMSSQKQASSALVKEVMINKVTLMGNEFEKPNSIVKYVLTHHGINISYHKAYRAKQSIMMEIYGTPEDSYAKLPHYAHMLHKKNPGSVIQLEYAPDGKFIYYFQALAASINGWQNCRPVLSIDGTFMKCKFGGTLLTAATSDGNNQIFPLAAAAVDSENDASWKWFITNLKKVFGNRQEVFGNRQDLVVISDRNKSIENSIAQVWPEVFHGLCTWHIKENMVKKYHAKFDSDLFFKIAKAFNHMKFEKYMRHLESGCPGIREELRNIGFDKWSRAYCPRSRWELMTSNPCESYNSAMKKARELPITAMFEAIRMSAQSWFNLRRVNAARKRKKFTKGCERQLKKQADKGHSMQVFPIDQYQFQVLYGTEQHEVNLLKKSCTCRRYDILGIPCRHASAVFLNKEINATSYISHYYMNNNIRNMYSGLIFPVGNQCDWVIPSNIKDIRVLPPNTKRPAGRPKKSRWKSSHEMKTTVKCGRCGRIGHNRRSCRNPIIQ